jgi:hypothetical protein
MNVPEDICRRCAAVLDEDNHPLRSSFYGCQRCRGKRVELLGRAKNMGQEDDAHLLAESKANAG